MSEYRKKYSKDTRTAEAARIRAKYPDRIPIIVEMDGGCNAKDIPKIDKQKFLVPADLTMGQFQYVVRKRIKMNCEKALFIFVNRRLVPTSQTISNTYEEHKHEDGFLYVIYSGENTFG